MNRLTPVPTPYWQQFSLAASLVAPIRAWTSREPASSTGFSAVLCRAPRGRIVCLVRSADGQALELLTLEQGAPNETSIEAQHLEVARQRSGLSTQELLLVEEAGSLGSLLPGDAALEAALSDLMCTEVSEHGLDWERIPKEAANTVYLWHYPKMCKFPEAKALSEALILKKIAFPSLGTRDCIPDLEVTTTLLSWLCRPRFGGWEGFANHLATAPAEQLISKAFQAPRLSRRLTLLQQTLDNYFWTGHLPRERQKALRFQHSEYQGSFAQRYSLAMLLTAQFKPMQETFVQWVQAGKP